LPSPRRPARSRNPQAGEARRRTESSMAGRSGSAAIVVALVEAAEAFDAAITASRIRDSTLTTVDKHALADALDEVRATKPKPERGEEDAVLHFNSAVELADRRKVDISDFTGALGCGVEADVQTCPNGSLSLLSVAFFLE